MSQEDSSHNKLKMHSPDLVAENLAWVAERFPGCITETKNEEGEVVQAVDFDLLKQELSTEVVEGPQERYHLNWPGKREALLAANAPIAKTLRPCREESVDFDMTRNLFIEGDNLDALKLLQETYLNRVRLIYLDPPYNTGNDFVYADDYSETTAVYLERSAQADEEGFRLLANPESAGRFHSSWLSMMYPRLRLARQLLADDGLILISVDDNELHNLRHLCDEIFGQRQFVATFKWNKTSKAPTLSDSVRNKYEYIVAYARNDAGKLRGRDSYNTMAPLFNSGNPKKKLVFPPQTIKCMFDDGTYGRGDYGKGDKAVTLLNDLVVKDQLNHEELQIEARFKWSQDTTNRRIKTGQLFAFKKPSLTTMYYYLDNGGEGSESKYIAPSDLISMDECNVERNDEGYVELRDIFGGYSPFNYGKPTSLLRHLCSFIPENDFIVMDFFAGSATTAHAVMQLNAEDGGTRRSILVQLDEACDEDSDAAKEGLATIADLGKERLRRVGIELKKAEGLYSASLDVGFRLLTIDSSNLKEVYYRPDVATADLLAGHVDNIKDDRSDEDLLFQVLLDWGVDLSLPIAKEQIAGREVFLVDTNALAACFGDGIDEAFVKELAKREPLRVVFRDAGYGGDDVKINVEQIFKQLSPSTEVKTI